MDRAWGHRQSLNKMNVVRGKELGRNRKSTRNAMALTPDLNDH